MTPPNSVPVLTVQPVPYRPQHGDRSMNAFTASSALMFATVLGAALIPPLLRHLPGVPSGVNPDHLKTGYMAGMFTLVCVGMAVTFAFILADRREYARHLNRYGLILGTPDQQVLMLTGDDQQTVQDHLGTHVALQYGTRLVPLDTIFTAVPFSHQTH